VALLAVAVLAVAVVADLAVPEEDMQAIFTSYVTRFNKIYAREDFFNRYNIFKENYAKIVAHNSLPAGENWGVKLGTNALADLTKAEYRQMLGFRLKDQKNGKVLTPMAEGESNGESIDWRTKGAVNPIKDQGQCGSCWAFSAVASAEAAIEIAGNSLLSLSEQELVDCTLDDPYNCEGCDGCLMATAFNYMKDKKTFCLESEYPYTEETGDTCKASKCTTKTPAITSYKNVTCADSNFCSKPLIPANETTMQAYVDLGVLSIAIEADSDVFQYYTDGIINSTECGTSLDHGVAIVGYNHDDATNQDYWIVRNSWGVSWGLKGYVYIAKGKNICGISLYSNQPYAHKPSARHHRA
jgi:cathepsin L